MNIHSIISIQSLKTSIFLSIFSLRLWFYSTEKHFSLYLIKRINPLRNIRKNIIKKFQIPINSSGKLFRIYIQKSIWGNLSRTLCLLLKKFMRFYLGYKKKLMLQDKEKWRIFWWKSKDCKKESRKCLASSHNFVWTNSQ